MGGSTGRKLRAGDWVEVRSAREIAATLDEHGALEALPFMPEMQRHCGQRFRVYKRAHKSCDTIHKTGNRRMNRAVHLVGLRCDGSAHGGCQAGCLLFWKEEWLRRVSDGDGMRSGSAHEGELESRLARAAVREPTASGDAPAYRCQATELFTATQPISRWDLTPYVEDLTSGNVGIVEFVRVLAIALFNWLQGLRGGGGFPRFQGGTLRGKTPRETLGVEPGELVEVRSPGEIAATLDVGSRNRGLFFDNEMVPYCGERRRVARRVERIIDERTGRMTELKNDCIVLEDVICRAHYSKGRLFCPRAITPYWREIWLRRAAERGSARSDQTSA
jgi:hypothetical protein